MFWVCTYWKLFLFKCYNKLFSFVKHIGDFSHFLSFFLIFVWSCFLFYLMNGVLVLELLWGEHEWQLMENTAATVQPRSLEPGKHLNFLIAEFFWCHFTLCRWWGSWNTHSQGASRISYSREFIMKYFCVTSADDYACVELHGKGVGKC